MLPDALKFACALAGDYYLKRITPGTRLTGHELQLGDRLTDQPGDTTWPESRNTAAPRRAP